MRQHLPIQRLNFYLLFILFLTPLLANANFDLNANCLNAYNNVLALKLNAARQLIATEKRIHPNNGFVPLLEDYVDYFYLLTTENKAEYERLSDNKTDRLDRISNNDKNSPWYLYAQAEINLHWALLRSRYGAFLTAAREMNRANSLLQENNKKFPNFHLNGKGLGLINAVMGALPDGFIKSTLSAFGLKGNLETGINLLDKLAENLPKSAYEPFYDETVFYYAYVLSDVAKSNQAYAKTMKYTARIPDSSLLKAYLKAYVSYRNGHNDEALNILANRPSGSAYQPFPYLEYLTGILKLNKLDYSAATYFDRFLQSNKGVNYIKDAYLHLGWISLLKGSDSGYNAYINKAKSAGNEYLEKDKQAVEDAKAPVPNKVLLTARLLYDGGYYAKALAILNEHRAEDFNTQKDRAEYDYRYGRICDALGKNDIALSSYQKAINGGKGLKFYYAAKSAVQIGKIYEESKNFAKAKAFFNLAINMSGHEQETSIENEAKQGLRRIARN